MQLLVQRPAVLPCQKVRIKLKNQFKVMLLQGIPVVRAERFREEHLFIDYKFKLLGQAFPHRVSHSYLFKGLKHQLIKIPVYQVVFIQEIPVECLPGDAAALHNLLDRNLIHGSRLHAFLHGGCQLISGFILFVPLIHGIPYPLWIPLY